jgi:hypothetical protein
MCEFSSIVGIAHRRAFRQDEASPKRGKTVAERGRGVPVRWRDGLKREAVMRIFTVTYEGRPAAIIRAADGDEAIAIARRLASESGRPVLRDPGRFAAREPNDAEMVDWLEHRSDHLLAELAAAS